MGRYPKQVARALMVAMAGVALHGCSISGAIDKMVSADDKAFALGIAKAACDGTLERYRDKLDPQLLADFLNNREKLKSFCPNGVGKARLVGFQTNTQMVNGATAKTQQFVVMTESPGRWSRATLIRSSQNGGPLLLQSLNLNATPEKPADIVQAEQWDQAVPYIRFGAIGVLVLLVGGVWWLIRRHDRKRNADG